MPRGVADQVISGLGRGYLLYLEKCRHIPFGLLINTLGFSLLSLLIAHIFAGDGSVSFSGDRAEYVCVSFFSYLLLQDNLFSAFGEAWRDKKHILNSNFSLIELNASHLFHAFVHIAVFLIILGIFFDNTYKHIFFFVIFMVWMIGLRQMAYIIGGVARWIGRTGSIMGRAFFVMSPILWVPVNERQYMLSEYNPFVSLLLNSGITWSNQGDVNPYILLYCILPVYALYILNKPFLRRWLCEKLY